MIRSVRFRIVGSVFAAIVSLLTIQAALVLDRSWREIEKEVDLSLQEEAAEVAVLLDTPQLQAFIDAESQRTKWDEILFEVRDSRGRLVAGSPGLPQEGFVPPPDLATGELRIWEQVHPTSRKGHTRIRIAESRADGYVVRVAETLKRHQKLHWSLRTRLAGLTAVVAVLAAFAAWLVASRALAPVRRITEHARQLGAMNEGELPRTGSGDEIDALAAVLNDLLRRVHAEVGRLRRLTADVGHALKTPLTALRAGLELQLDRGDGSDGSGQAALLDELDGLIRLVNRLLLLERLDAGASGSESTLLDLGALVEDLTEYLRVMAEERSIDLKCATDHVLVRAHPDRLREAIANLIDNALRHTPPGGRIDVEVQRRAGHAEVRIADSGPGLAAEHLERVFERFWSEPGSGRPGLGLPIARAIARAYGGDVRAFSPGGACFVLELPIARADERSLILT